jgi:TatA/E family protein of Tat protein translocase
MFGSLGGAEILLILVVALLLFGPRKLPEMGKTIGRALAEFRRATTDFKATLEREADLQAVRDAREGVRRAGREVERAVREIPPAIAPPGHDAPPTERGGTAPADAADADGRPTPDS